MTNQANARSASSVADKGLVGDVDFIRDVDLSFSLHKIPQDFLSEVQYAWNCPHRLHPGFIYWGLASWDGNSEVLGSYVFYQSVLLLDELPLMTVSSICPFN